MLLITKEHEKKLKAAYGKDSGKPIVKLFGGGAFTWLISQMYPDGDTLYGLCDIGQGTPEIGCVSLSELKSLKFPPFGLGVERDLYFSPDKSLIKYYEEARQAGYIAA